MHEFIYGFIIGYLSSIIKVLGTGAMLWLYIRNRKMPFLLLALSMASAFLVDIADLSFNHGLVSINITLLVYLLVRVGFSVLHALFFLIAGIYFLRNSRTPEK